MAESHVVSGLIAKRGELAGQVETHQAQIKRLLSALSHLDGTIKLFAPEVDLRSVQSCITRKRNQHFAQGEAHRMTLEVLRDAKDWMCSRGITDALMQRKKIAPDATIAAGIRKNILAVLHRLEKKKQVTRIRVDGAPLKWKLI